METCDASQVAAHMRQISISYRVCSTYYRSVTSL